MATDSDRVALSPKNQQRIADAYARFQMEVGSIVSVLLDQHDLDPKDYHLTADFSTLVKNGE